MKLVLGACKLVGRYLVTEDNGTGKQTQEIGGYSGMSIFF
jgi:hypothetical protein